MPVSNEKSDILVVDDSPDNVNALKRILKREGCHVRGASNGKSALHAIKTNAPDLIILDIQMPGMDGYDVCRRLKADIKFADIPVIFISGLSDIEDKVKAFQAGGADFITKSFHTDEVILRVNIHILAEELICAARDAIDKKFD
jgi:DNA-binding response OmpR family regulator